MTLPLRPWEPQRASGAVPKSLRVLVRMGHIALTCASAGAAITLCGCATAPPTMAVPRGEAISIAVVKAPDADGEINIHNQALRDGMTVGVGSGVAVGTLAALTCGPFFWWCAPLGVLAGGAYGTAAGAAIGWTGALPEDKAARVRARLIGVQRSHDLLDELCRHVTERVQAHWSLNPTTPAYLVTVELEDIRLTSTRDERIAMVVSVLVRVRPARAEPRAVAKEKPLEYVGPFTSLVLWLDESSDVIDSHLSIASRQLALQIVSEITPQ
jgi:hypothetical protein